MDDGFVVGASIVFAHPHAAHRPNRDVARECLSVGAVYTVEYVREYGDHAGIYLKEIPGFPFDSRLFSPSVVVKR